MRNHILGVRTFNSAVYSHNWYNFDYISTGWTFYELCCVYVQMDSSEPSPQSLSESQTYKYGIQRRLSHWNSPGAHDGGGAACTHPTVHANSNTFISDLHGRPLCITRWQKLLFTSVSYFPTNFFPTSVNRLSGDFPHDVASSVLTKLLLSDFLKSP